MALSYSFHISNKGHSLSTINKVKSVSKHNLRCFSKTEIYNKNDIEILVGSKSILDDIKKIYHEEFDECLAKYNAKQKREDRKINNYLDHVSNSRSDVAVEIIIQLGDMDFWQDKTADEKRKMSYLFKDQVKYLTQIMPNFKIASAVIHYDENSPHLHLVGVPIADGYKKGLEKQVAKTKVFTKESLVNLQNVMRQRIEKGIKLNKDLFGDEVVKEKEKGRNKDLPKESLAEFSRLQAQNDDLKRERESLLKDIEEEGQTFELLKSCSSTYTKLISEQKSEKVTLEKEIEENRRILKEIEENRLKAQNEAQKAKEKELEEVKILKDQQTQIQNSIEFLKAEEEKLLKNLNLDEEIVDDEGCYDNPVANKLDREFKRYKKLLKNHDKDYIVDKAYETSQKKNLVIAATITDFTEEETEILLGKENLLDEYYKEWWDYNNLFLKYRDFFNDNDVRSKILSKILDERPKESLLERADISKKQKSISYEPEI